MPTRNQKLEGTKQRQRADRGEIQTEALVEMRRGESYAPAMSVITATMDVEDDVAGIVTNLLRQFPRGARVHLAISEVPAALPVPGLEEYRQRVAAARAIAPRSPWRTTAETMKALREGEAD